MSVSEFEVDALGGSGECGLTGFDRARYLFLESNESLGYGLHRCSVPDADEPQLQLVTRRYANDGVIDEGTRQSPKTALFPVLDIKDAD
jgi:hypothetical protein